ncbi:PQQ-binding-like beta-propeller repeat protein [Salarchaeum sp. III]|uniref:outer membrane protein assembly factor BamB family protein n=1 Tax=Salarchaeum sp. III TaxID=3107927 RepID=UPI002ED91AD2
MPSSEPASSRRSALAAVGAAVSASIAGCSGIRDAVRNRGVERPERQVAAEWTPSPGQWPMNGYSYARRSHNPHATPPRESPSVAWSWTVPGDIADIVVVDDRAYVRTSDALVALDARDGRVRWRRPRSTPGSLLYVAGRLYDAENETLRALTPAGTPTWTHDVEISPLSYAVFERAGWVYLLARDTAVRLHADTGEVVSTAERDVFVPTTAGGPVYTGRFSFGAFDVSDGFDRRWVMEADSGYTAYDGAAVAGDTVYRPEAVFHGSPSGRLGLYRTADGGVRAAIPFEHTPFSPAVTGNEVFVSTATVTAGSIGTGGGLIALSRDGFERWTYAPDASLTAPVSANDAVYVGPWANDDVPLVAFDATAGRELWRLPVTGTPSLAAAGNTLYVATSERVRALRE